MIDDLWYKNAVFYCLNVGTFMDANGGRGARDRLSIAGAGAQQLTNLLSEDHSVPDQRHRHHLSIEPYGYRWYRVGAQLEAATRAPQ